MTATSASVVVRLVESGQSVRLHVSPDAALSSPVYSTVVITTAAADNAVTLAVQGLRPNTDYFYGVEVAGVLRSEPLSRGRLRTFPLGRGSFKIAFGSCGDFRASDQSVYAAILAERPLLFINTGDLHYSDTNSTAIDDYRRNYDSVLSQPSQAALYRGVPLAYVWDDHDYCGNDSDTTALGRDTARAAFRERTPHYPISTAAGGTVAQAFTIGRVRVIMTDLRSGSSSADDAESAAKTRLGAAQKEWFKQELIAARTAGFPLILWVCPDPWIGPAAIGSDTWGGHATERTELANFIRDHQISNLVLLSGDMHALAYDDGTNSDYATGGGAPLTVLHGAALTRVGSVKGGPYVGQAVPGNRQFGLLEIYDHGGPSVACVYRGVRVGEGTKLTHVFSGSAPVTGAQALVNISTLSQLMPGNDLLTSGFVLSGSAPRTVLLRAAGPTLRQFGVADGLARPRLMVFKGERMIASNEGWAPDVATANRMEGAFTRTGAFRFKDAASRDAALLLTLQPGAYTLQVKSVDGSSGATLAEVYEVP